MCTIIGTSTNLLVVALDDRGDIKAGQPVDNVNIFEIGMAAVPIAVVGLLYMLIFSRFLLPKTTSTAPEQYLQEARKYTTALRLVLLLLYLFWYRSCGARFITNLFGFFSKNIFTTFFMAAECRWKIQH